MSSIFAPSNMSNISMKDNFYYTPSEKHIRLAAQYGISNVVVDSRGHGKSHMPGMKDDHLCLMKKHNRIYKARKSYRITILKEVDQISKRVRMAVSLGLKPFIHSYEISLPAEIRTLYPGLFVKDTIESRRVDPLCEKDRYLCLSDVRVRRLIADKIEEVLRHFPGLAGYIYSFHESQLTTFNHFCDKCKHMDRFRLVKWLYESICEGAKRVNKDLVIIPRLWGITHPEGLFYAKSKEMAYLMDYDPSYWFCRRLPARKKWHYRPAPVNRKLESLIKGTNSMLIYKATWGDYSLFQPLNKWAGSYGAAPQIIELSLEHCVLGKWIPLIISRQHQDMIRRLKAQNIRFCIVPVNWGAVWKGPRLRKDVADPDNWGLNFLNLHLLDRLLKNPDLSLLREAAAALKKKYGVIVPNKLVSYLFKTAEILRYAINIHSVFTAMNLDYLLAKPTYTFYHVLSNTFWYQAMWKDGKKRLSPDDRNMKKIFKEKDKAIDDAEELLFKAKAVLQGIKSVKLKKECVEFFTNFRDLVKFICITRKRIWIEYKFQKEKKSCYKWMKELDSLIDQEKVMAVRSSLIQKIYSGYFKKKFGW